MAETSVALGRDVVTVDVGGTAAAYVPARRELFELSAQAVDVIRRLEQGADPVRTETDVDVVRQLVALGVLCEPAEEPASR